MFHALILRRNEYGQFSPVGFTYADGTRTQDNAFSSHQSIRSFLTAVSVFATPCAASPTSRTRCCDHNNGCEETSLVSKWVTVSFLTLPLLVAIEFVRVKALLSLLLLWHFLLLRLRFSGSGSRKTSGRNNVTSRSPPSLNKKLRREFPRSAYISLISLYAPAGTYQMGTYFVLDMENVPQNKYNISCVRAAHTNVAVPTVRRESVAAKTCGHCTK